MASSSKLATCSSSFSCGWSYDVFVSFRGCDTRLGFVDHLYGSLFRKGIKVWIDAEIGDNIALAIFEAIEQSRVSVVIVSPNFVNSTWCLQELVKILECKGIILPVFYGVEPSDIRTQSGRYAEAFASLELRYGMALVQKWMRALKAVANLSGFIADRNSGESRLIEAIVQVILKKLGSPFQNEENIGVDVSSNTKIQKSFLECLEDVAMCNHYNDVFSLTSKISRRRRKITDWEKGALIGCGSFASVYKGSLIQRI